MPNYRRNLLFDGTYFFTANLANRRLKSLTENIGLLRAAIRQARARHPFAIDAAVILPDHLHMIWTLPADDADFALRWRLIKSAFSHHLHRGERILPAAPAKASAGFGSGGIGSILCATRPISLGTSIRPLQPDQTWERSTGAGLAVLLVPPLGAARCLPKRLGGRFQR